MHSLRVKTFTFVRFCVTTSLVAVCFVISNNSRAADFFNGETIYKTYCQSCHGNSGQGIIGGAPNFTRGQGLMKPDASLYDVIVNGKNAMPAFRGVLKEEEYFDVIAYLRSFL